jgi:hypothetical protein
MPGSPLCSACDSAARGGVAWLVKAEVATTRQAQHRQQTPAFIGDSPAFDTRPVEARYFGTHIVAHEIDLMLAVDLGGMKGKLGWRRRENQPTATGIDRRKSEHITEESAIGHCILRVYDCVHSSDGHVSLPSEA